LLVVKLVLFDIDGTLIRTGGAGLRAFAETFGEVFNLPEATKTLQFAGRTDVSLVRECFLKNGVEPTRENFDRFFAEYPVRLQRWLGTLPAEVLPGIDSFLDDLYALPDRPVIGLLTGNIRRGAELKLRRLGLWERFELGAFADDHEDRNCIAAAARKRGEQKIGRTLHGDEIVVIGDTPHDVTCGKSIAAKVLAVATGIHSREELARETPTWAVDKVSDLRVADILC
jgi:phosphoglycolate phosphatase-like HAD superfamily hydrolase